jgi:hypothetical protein
MKKVLTSSFSKTRIPFPLLDCYYFRWVKGRETGIHDHAKKGCLMVVLSGQLKEKLYNKNLEYLETNTYKSKGITFINNDRGYHSILPKEKSTSLHFYYPKGHNTKYYKNKNI